MRGLFFATRPVKRRTDPPAFPDSWHCYLLLCADGGYYCGITSRLSVRLRDHRAGRGTGFTKARRPTVLVWCEEHCDRRSAAAREQQIKGWSREKKRLLAEGREPFAGLGKAMWVSLG